MKRISEKILAVALCFVMLLGTVAIGGDGFADMLEAISFRASAADATSGTCGDNLTWSLSNGTLTISGTGAMTNYSSSSSAPWYSSRTTIKTVVIETGVTSIGNYAFYYCTSLTSVTIPDGVTSIGESAFEDCTSLTSITIPGSVTSIGSSAFKFCNLTSITIPDSVTSIGSFAFYYCKKLANINIPDSIISIGDGAFFNCISLTSITIPDSVTSIGENAFGCCTSLKSITVEERNTEYSDVDGVLFNKDKTIIECYPAGKGTTSYTIPDSVTSIDSDAFMGCTSLTCITIPDSVTSISSYVFSGCISLESIVVD